MFSEFVQIVNNVPCDYVSATSSASGEILNEEFLKPLGLTANALVKAIGVPMATVHFAAMTCSTARRLDGERAKGALSRVTAVPVGDSEVQRFERSAAVERLERLEQKF